MKTEPPADNVSADVGSYSAELRTPTDANIRNDIRPSSPSFPFHDTLQKETTSISITYHPFLWHTEHLAQQPHRCLCDILAAIPIHVR